MVFGYSFIDFLDNLEDGKMFEKYGAPLVRSAIIGLIRKLSIDGENVNLGSEKDAHLMKWVFENKYMPEKEIRKAVHERICEIGREGYEWCVAEGTHRHPNKVRSPRAFGYAIKYKKISNEEMQKIVFGHKEIREDYVLWADGFIQSVMKILENGTAFKSYPTLSSV